jgi:hypothetical protein
MSSLGEGLQVNRMRNLVAEIQPLLEVRRLDDDCRNAFHYPYYTRNHKIKTLVQQALFLSGCLIRAIVKVITKRKGPRMTQQTGLISQYSILQPARRSGHPHDSLFKGLPDGLPVVP